MRASQLLIATLKETPADAVVISHQLMLRAGMIRQASAGIYSWLPLGLRLLKRVERIVREEMNRAGAVELSNFAIGKYLLQFFADGIIRTTGLADHVEQGGDLFAIDPTIFG